MSNILRHTKSYLLKSDAIKFSNYITREKNTFHQPKIAFI